jgi:hypothetical protein
MKLSDLKCSDAERPVYSASVADVDGNSRYELAITGPSAIVEEVFAKVDFDLEIVPGAKPGDFDEQSQRFLQRRIGDRKFGSAPLDEIVAQIGRKPLPAPGDLKEKVTVYLRPTEGEGTFWGMWFPFLVVPLGVALFFVLPRVWTTWSVVLPRTGNPDILLFRDAPLPPPVATALSPALVADGLSFTGPPLPWAQFHPFHMVFTFTPGFAWTDFGVGGHSLPWFG